MTALKTPAPDAPAEEWGAFAASIPGAPAAWHRTEEFILVTGDGQHIALDGTWWSPIANRAGLLSLDVDHPATAGCLWVLAGRPEVMVERGGERVRIWDGSPQSIAQQLSGTGPTKGRALIAYAAASGRWPGGEG